jgi:hypothetical protein
MSEKRPEILAVHKQKLEQFLKELDLWEPLIKGEFKCVTCGVTITKDNVGTIIPSGENIVFCCSNHDCFFKAIKRQEDSELEEAEFKEAELEDAKH